MKKNKKDNNSKYTIKKIFGVIKKDRDKHWGKYLMRSSFADNGTTIDIRNMLFKDDDTYVVGKGISLQNQEADILTDLLVSNGYGTKDCLYNELKRRQKMYGITSMKLDDENKERDE